MIEPSNNLLDEYLLDATANDYETLSTITLDVEKFASADGQNYSTDELKRAIGSLVATGKLRAYKYSPAKEKYEQVKFSMTDIESLWFCSRQ